MNRLFLRPSSTVPTLLAAALAVLLLAGCDKEREEAEGRDWRPVIEQIDEALIQDVMKAEGWAGTGESHTMTLEAEAVREMGGRAEGDTHITSYDFDKGDMSASISVTEYPGDVKPPQGDRGISMEQSLLAAGSRGVGVTVYDSDFAFQKEESEALLDAIIGAAEEKLE